MIAYSAQWLKDLSVVKAGREAFDEHLISREELSAIENRYPGKFYTPHFIIRIGLFLLTLVILIFSFGLMALLFMSNIENAYSGLMMFFSIVCFVALEVLINRKKHFRSGVDEALLYVASLLLFLSIFFIIHPSNLVSAGIVFIISIFSAMRYADRLMVLLAYLSLGGMLFFTAIEIGSLMKQVVPFLLLIYSMLCYLFSSRKNELNVSFASAVYAHCFQFLKIISLLGVYISVNFWVVRELSNIMFNLHLQAGQTIPFGWLFWISTLMIPALYIYIGLRKKDRIFLRIGMLLVAAMMITIRYYYPVYAIEWWIGLAGLLMIFSSWILIRYLRIPRRGFTDQEEHRNNHEDAMQVESLVIAETFSGTAGTVEQGFGGGSFGGGGSTGTF